MERIKGLDSIRFVCALWVFFGHGAAPEIPNPFPDGSIAEFALRGFYNNLWSGPSAVIIFFIISGFCIHFPFAGSDKPVPLKQFYSRRFIRLCIPVAIAIPLGSRLGVQLTFFDLTILWSLLAEFIYYLCYPLLRLAHLRFRSWKQLLICAYLVALVIAATNPTAGNYPSYGPALNWLLGLPCWLLGCQLADKVKQGNHPSVATRSIWAWRAAILLAACICSVLRFHSPIGYPWTLNLFAIPATLWLAREISYRRQQPPPALLEWAGLWSYSLYLIHVIAQEFYVARFTPSKELGLSWLAMLAFVLAACYLFYLLIEKPSHMLARKVSRQFGKSH